VLGISVDKPSLVAILTNTPSWVFVVFIALVLLGYQQRYDRTVGRRRLLFLPVAMLILSCYGIVSSFGLGLLSFLPWALGIGAVTVLLPKRLKFSVKLVAEGIFLVKGSWWPLVLMMGIFFIKYITGYALARNLAIAFQPWFIAIVSLSLGIFSGVFLARVIAALRTRPEDGSYI
jgi:hypothetical protein